MRRIHALALVPFFALAACSAPAAPATTAAPTTSAPATSAPASASPSAATPTAPANAGPTLSGEGYTLTLPKGWKDATADFKKLQVSVDTGGKNDSDTRDGFADNVNVIVQASPALPFEQFKAALQKQLETAGSTNIEFKADSSLDGKEALQVWSTTKGAGDAHTIQFMAFNNAKVFIVTVSTNLSDAKAETLAEQVISGWKWAV